ncbi:serine palmitoyltransferase small subunit B isoform X1 [Acanthopagrus latus]|uniref:serine palmitoyltransferase small subunit B isoform X1 n=2 Tax=Sparidae TaxID=8169 RepID=UPI00187CD737|nr:serine palmitoyltransferase small subunit B isoform X1 [Acanthopagrus latus]
MAENRAATKTSSPPEPPTETHTHTHTQRPVASSLRGHFTCTICEPACKMNFKNLLEYLAWLYYQYLLITGIYVLEPWEKSIFNSILFSAIAMVIYTSYVFVPIHVRLALEFFSGIFGGQPESTMALMN